MLDAGKRSSENKCGILLPLFLIWLINVKVAIFSFTRFSSFKILSSLKNGPRFSCLCATKKIHLTHNSLLRACTILIVFALFFT